MSVSEVMSTGRPHVKLTDVRSQRPTMLTESAGARFLMRAVQVAMFAYAMGEAVRYMKQYLIDRRDDRRPK